MRVPLIYVYSVPDVMKLAKALADGRRERREFDHVRAQSATIRAVTPGAALRMPFARARPTARADAHPRRGMAPIDGVPSERAGAAVLMLCLGCLRRGASDRRTHTNGTEMSPEEFVPQVKRRKIRRR